MNTSKPRKYRRVVRPLGKGREAVRCVDGRWRIFEVKSIPLSDEERGYSDGLTHVRRWVTTYVEEMPGRWPQAYFGTPKVA